MKKVTIKSSVGLHARPAAIFCMAAKKFESAVTISKDGESFDAKSVMMVMTASIENGDEVTIEAIGTDSEQAEITLVEVLEGMN